MKPVKITKADSFVPFEIAKALTLVGYDHPTMGFYATHHDQAYNNIALKEPTLFTSDESHRERVMIRKVVNHCVAPLWDDVIEWFKIRHKIDIETAVYKLEDGVPVSYVYLIHNNNNNNNNMGNEYPTRREALGGAFLKALTLI